jgi:hypothetical protein
LQKGAEDSVLGAGVSEVLCFDEAEADMSEQGRRISPFQGVGVVDTPAVTERPVRKLLRIDAISPEPALLDGGTNGTAANGSNAR